jgi:hypothetical protein
MNAGAALHSLPAPVGDRQLTTLWEEVRRLTMEKIAYESQALFLEARVRRLEAELARRPLPPDAAAG